MYVYILFQTWMVWESGHPYPYFCLLRNMCFVKMIEM